MHPVGKCAEELEILLQPLAVQRRPLLIPSVKEGIRKVGSQTALLHSSSRPFGEGVHVEEGCRAALDHLEGGYTGTPIDVLLREVSLHGPDHIIEPVHQIEIIAVATEEGHCRVGVTIHEAWYDSQSVPLN